MSLYDFNDINYILLGQTNVDGFMVAFSLLDPFPFLQRIKKIRKHNVGVIVRSCLHDGFLTGKFNESTSFTDENDQRSKWSREKIKKTVQMVERFRFLEKGKLEQGIRSMAAVAARYPLSFPEVCVVVMSTKNEAQASMNFGEIPDNALGAEELKQIRHVQKTLGLFDIPVQQRIRAVLSRLKRKFS